MRLIYLLLLLPMLSYADDFRLMTWNVYMLPRPVKFSRQGPRSMVQAEELKKIVDEIDFLVLNEAFTKRSRNTIAEELAESLPYTAKLKKKGKLPIVMDSGVMVLSRFPMTVLGESYYKRCATADCFSSKGVILVEITLPSGKRIQIAATHMQAGGGKSKFSVIRTEQLEQIKELLKLHATPKVPQLLVGDLNINEENPEEFAPALAQLEMETAPVIGDLKTSKSGNTDCFGVKNRQSVSGWLDHVLMSTQGSESVLDHKRAMTITGAIRGRVCDLSDHLPVSALINVEN